MNGRPVGKLMQVLCCLELLHRVGSLRVWGQCFSVLLGHPLIPAPRLQSGLQDQWGFLTEPAIDSGIHGLLENPPSNGLVAKGVQPEREGSRIQTQVGIIIAQPSLLSTKRASRLIRDLQP